jgi:hypothetical protein
MTFGGGASADSKFDQASATTTKEPPVTARSPKQLLALTSQRAANHRSGENKSSHEKKVLKTDHEIIMWRDQLFFEDKFICLIWKD